MLTTFLLLLIWVINHVAIILAWKRAGPFLCFSFFFFGGGGFRFWGFLKGSRRVGPFLGVLGCLGFRGLGFKAGGWGSGSL